MLLQVYLLVQDGCYGSAPRRHPRRGGSWDLVRGSCQQAVRLLQAQHFCRWGLCQSALKAPCSGRQLGCLGAWQGAAGSRPCASAGAYTGRVVSAAGHITDTLCREVAWMLDCLVGFIKQCDGWARFFAATAVTLVDQATGAQQHCTS